MSYLDCFCYWHCAPKRRWMNLEQAIQVFFCFLPLPLPLLSLYKSILRFPLFWLWEVVEPGQGLLAVGPSMFFFSFSLSFLFSLLIYQFFYLYFFLSSSSLRKRSFLPLIFCWKIPYSSSSCCWYRVYKYKPTRSIRQTVDSGEVNIGRRQNGIGRKKGELDYTEKWLIVEKEIRSLLPLLFWSSFSFKHIILFLNVSSSSSRFVYSSFRLPKKATTSTRFLYILLNSPRFLQLKYSLLVPSSTDALRLSFLNVFGCYSTFGRNTKYEQTEREMTKTKWKG